MRKNDINPDTADREYRRFDWACSKETYAPPEWECKRSAPVSHSRGQPLRLEVNLRVPELQGALPLEGIVVGQPVGRDDAAFTFQSEKRTFEPGVHTLRLRGQRPLPTWPTCLKRCIRWTLQTEAGSVALGVSGVHAVYVTFGPPIEEGEVEDGVTRARMPPHSRPSRALFGAF